ncbi:hypothetical protein [Pseudorhodoplanes sp.]|uniref:hypothetical protein n=1 Tax=Pseudorhodoplanes sp. TaxID=1934341 RepID=UPI002CFF15F4|nr:hypothetical protein [Pseudorhodoplanes sp.]HWV52455.1 hypothetical protein [Pseudorhodoplanes sp.]
MKKAAIVTTAIVTVAIAALSASARPASAQACVGGIIFAAFYASLTENRELSATEAATCGLFYGADRDKAVRGGKPPVAKAPAKKPARTAAAKAKPQ